MSGWWLGLAAILFFVILRHFPGLADTLYGNLLYPVVRALIDHTIGLLPFPVVYLFPWVVIFLLVKALRRFSSRRGRVRVALNALGWLVFLFYSLWGFNYARPNLSERGMLSHEQPSTEALFGLGLRTVEQMNLLRQDTMAVNFPTDRELEAHLRKEVGSKMESFGMKDFTRCKVRTIGPPGVLRRWGITGIYFPFTGEALLESSHPWPEKPFVMAHELSHSMGITDEGEANLIAYLAGKEASHIAVRYCAHLNMWQYLRYDLSRRAPEMADSLYGMLSERVERDLALLRSERQKFKEWFPQLGDQVNDTYLRLQGVDAGTESYLSLPVRFLQYEKSGNLGPPL